MTFRTALNLINTLGRAEAALRGQEFLAPLIGDGRARIHVHGLSHELAVDAPAPGWWICRARDTRSAEIVGQAQPWQRGEYLTLWPALRLVLLEPRKRMTWLALPFNPADAAQRFGHAGPVAVRLVDGGQPFERVIGRVAGAAIWYDDVDRRADPAIAEALRTALAAERDKPRIAGLGAGERAVYDLALARRAQASTPDKGVHTERRLRAALEIGGAQLIGYEPVEGGWRVIWERSGQRGVTLVGADLDVISAGVCLNGADSRFDLASIINVVYDAPSFARWHDD